MAAANRTHRITLIPGDGIGPEVSSAVVTILEAAGAATGVAFDWQMLKGVSPKQPWFLAGGLNPENVARAVAVSGARLVDVSSGVESAPGVKSETLIADFVTAARAKVTA